MMKPGTTSLAIAAAAVALGIAASGCGSDSSTTDKTAAKPSYLFSFEGDDAVMTQRTGASQFTFRLPVDSTSKVVTWFTDRPARDAGIMRLREFVALWSKPGEDGFKEDPPNVSIIYGTSGRPMTMIATMSAVKLVKNGNGEQLQATMTVVPESTRAAFAKSGAHLAAHAKRASPVTEAPSPQLTRKVAVFVDPEVGYGND